jgi:endoglycosylceramidase
VDRLVRTYPQRVAGRPLRYDYDPATRVMTLLFREEAGVRGPTEIYVPAARRYPDGFAVVVSDPDGEWRQAWDGSRETLRLWTDPSRPTHAVCVAPTADDCPGR